MQAKKLGYHGETLAAQYLQKKGYKILSSNFTVRGGEIDLVARDPAGVIVFIEVKTRTQGTFGAGEESVTMVKKRRMQRAIGRYLAAWPTADPDCRIDIIDIQLDPATHDLLHIAHMEDIE